MTGGTGQFADAAGNVTGTVSAVALLARNPDGSCSLMQQPRHEVDKFAESGTLLLLNRPLAGVYLGRQNRWLVCLLQIRCTVATTVSIRPHWSPRIGR